jgi:hypothetical protein
MTELKSPANVHQRVIASTADRCTPRAGRCACPKPAGSTSLSPSNGIVEISEGSFDGMTLRSTVVGRTTSAKNVTAIERDVVLDADTWEYPSPLVAAGRRWSPLVAAGRRWSPLVAAGCRWLPLVAAGCRWLPLVAAGCRWLPLVAAGCRWLPLVAAGCRWSPFGQPLPNTPAGRRLHRARYLTGHERAR